MVIGIAVLSAVFIFCFFYILFYRLGIKRIRVDDRISKLITKESEVEKADKGKEKKRRDKRKSGFAKKMAAELESAGILLKAEEYLLIWAASTIVPSLLFYIVGGQLLSVVAVLLVGLIIPPFLVARSKRKRMKKFEKQLADSIVLISNSLRAGFTFQQAMESVSKEMPEPISGEFRRTLLEIQLGSATDEAMERMVERTNSADVSLLISAVLIQWKAGGNLADVLDNISGTIRERLRIKGEIRVLTSSGRMSGLIIGMLPIFLVVILMIINPVYITEFFTTTIGIILIVIAVIMELAGFMIIRKIINIKV
ncbi:MAG: secretion system protein [Clostridia bacterium]|jgi:tight adherence protein B|nr:secretion system protein [Clostridia bacterium]